MEPVLFTTYHLVKSEDLNHHGTLYAGRTAEWFVEAGFIAAASLASPESVMCLKIHGMTFTSPVFPGALVRIESKIVLTGKTRIVAFIKLTAEEKEVVRGFITFIHVSPDHKPIPHGIMIEPVTDEDQALYVEASALI